MPAPNIHQCVECVIHASAYGVYTFAHVLHFRSLLGTVNAGDLDNVAEVVSSWIQGEYVTYLSAEITFSDLFLKARDVDEGVELGFDMAGVPGADGAAIAKLDDTLVVSLRTGFAGRSRHGKFYTFPPIGPNYQDNRSFTTLYRDHITAALDVLRVAALDSGNVWCVASGELDRMTPITSFAASLALGNQDRRKKAR